MTVICCCRVLYKHLICRIFDKKPQMGLSLQVENHCSNEFYLNKITTYGSIGAGRIAKWLNVLAAKPDDLSSVLGTHMVKGENQFPQIVFWLPPARSSLYMCTSAPVCTCTHTHAQINVIKHFISFPVLLKGALHEESKYSTVWLYPFFFSLKRLYPYIGVENSWKLFAKVFNKAYLYMLAF